MAKIMIFGFIISFILCVVINVGAFFAEKIMKKKTIKNYEQKIANKEE